MPDVRLGLPSERRTVSRVLSILRSERVRISCFLGLQLSVHECDTYTTSDSLGGPLATIGLLEDTFMIAGLTPLAGRSVFGSDALHLEPTANGTSTWDVVSGEEIYTRIQRTHRDPRVGFALGSSPFSVFGLAASPSSSCRDLLLRSS